ncbi:MAG TPA: hypothetical protein VGC20_16180 [bacterium]|jgi:hypothetical protein
MTFDGNNKVPRSVPALAVKVLGGTFHVSAVMLDPDDSQDEVLSILSRTPADRWFVMVSDDAGDAQDALAMIDDNLEFQIYAHGVLRQD